MKLIAIIPAGGKGFRSGHSVPKQYIKVNKKELLVYTLEIFQKCKLVNQIIIPAEKAYHKKIKSLVKKYNLTKVSDIIKAGNTRQGSVFNSIKYIKAEKNDLILVHDAARPLLKMPILNNAINFAKKRGNSVVCIKANDTLVEGKSVIHSYIDREKIYYVQTPQIFKFEDFLKAKDYLEKNDNIFTDESSLMKKIGKKIYIVEGLSQNIKITTKEDIAFFKKIIS